MATVALSQPSQAVQINQYNGYVNTYSAPRRIPEPKAIAGLATVSLMIWHRRHKRQSHS